MLALTLLALTPALALNWGDRCETWGYGVCEWDATCGAVSGVSAPGYCPGLPDEVKCCYKMGCMPPGACPTTIRYGECPGGADNVMCEGYWAWCGHPDLCRGTEAVVLDGFCPGGEDNKLCRARI
ncbi:hypothetical protein Q8F55_006251 [Vanrija albida]|uniref:Uncharacterized protein n=1 Tax=Vanrija albida TaxID=181172 RepID=A0ABR3PWK3_9TREE